ncbi:uncharacterized protein BCR38DRAFT_485542 [Pseudomassariella vexata]|uniref:Prenylcysteine lyase domain-containing protein n=1 Tax=Pseudomassariella vexata TaxID=1141098 RepID=A0A1Y2E0I9_9PEZI|nr:uncharacterized protein BCR38DRAFT_485542 [Pseudomassariella vexata]ORY64385.1 hypothetical protein BCR38DRAFT_485542 [Pseudomassariella vexata]
MPRRGRRDRSQRQRNREMLAGLSDREQSPPPAYTTKESAPPPYAKRQPHEGTPLLASTAASSYSHASSSHTQASFGQGATGYPKQSLQSGLSTRGLIGDVCALALACLALVVVVQGLIYSVSTYNPTPAAPVPTYSVAIIGAGPAGVSAAYHLRAFEVSEKFKLNITVLESAPSIGGRLALIDSRGERAIPYDDPAQDPISAEDIAGPALMWDNPLFTKASEKFPWDKVDFDELPSSEVGYYDGKHLVSRSTRPYDKTPTWSWAWFHQVFQYGASVWKTQEIVREVDLRQKLRGLPTIRTVHELLSSLGIDRKAHESSTETLHNHDISQLYRDEVVAPRVQRVLGQRLDDITGLALSMALAKEDRVNSHTGGDFLETLERILRRADATVLTSSTVTGIKYEELNEKSAWLVESVHGTSNLTQYGAFDHVILAAPGAEKNALHRYDTNAFELPGHRSVHVEFFISSTRIDPLAFGESDALHDQILFIQKLDQIGLFQGVHEIAYVREIVRRHDGVDIVEHLYRCVSDHYVTDLLLHSLPFAKDGASSEEKAQGITWTYQTRIESAYPLLYPKTSFPPFRLSEDGLWATSAMYAVGSTVDFSWLAGKTVAEQMISTLRK